MPPAKRTAEKKSPAKRAPARKKPAPPPEPEAEVDEPLEFEDLNEEQKLDALRTGLLADAWRLRNQMFAPTVRKEVKVTSLGEGITEAEVITVELEEPTFADKKLIVQSIDGIVSKVHALTPGRGIANGTPVPPKGDDSGGVVSDFVKAQQHRAARRANAASAASPRRGRK